MDDIPKASSGTITAGIQENALIAQTVEFVRTQLPRWRDDPDRPKESSENQLNSQLCKFLTREARLHFPMVHFDHQEFQPKRRSVDIGAALTETTWLEGKLYTIYDPLILFEGKRLPAPSSNREKEYVTGFQNNSGGIQRFKLAFHGATMAQASIIGYIQKKAQQNWRKQINAWITELSEGKYQDGCIWNNEEKLELLEEDLPNGVGSYESNHPRTVAGETSAIKIVHLWVTMA